MKLGIMPKERAWWGWLLTIVLLATGLAGVPAGFMAATVLVFGKTLFYWWKLGRVNALAVQIRLSYTLVLVLCFISQLRWLFWLATVGTGALLVFGYCLMGRMLSLLPPNRAEPMTFDLRRRTFFTAPVVMRRGARSACGGSDGVCELEARVASLRPRCAEADSDHDSSRGNHRH